MVFTFASQQHIIIIVKTVTFKELTEELGYEFDENYIISDDNHYSVGAVIVRLLVLSTSGENVPSSNVDLTISYDEIDKRFKFVEVSFKKEEKQ